MRTLSLFFLLSLAILNIGKSQQDSNLKNLSLTQVDSIVLSYFYVGDLHSALPYAERSLVLSKQLYGELDSNYLNSLTYLGGINWMLNRYDKAKVLFTESVEVSRVIYGKQHLNYANALNNLGNLYEELGQMDVAEKLFISSVDILKATVGINHPDYSHTLNNLAGVYEHTQRFEEAEKLYLQALTNTKSHKDHNYATILNNLAGVYEELNRYQEAEKLYTETLVLTDTLFGKESNSYSTVLNNLALLYSNMGNYEKAISYLKEANATVKKGLGANSTDFIIGTQNLGVLYYETEAFQEAEELLLQAYNAWVNAKFRDNVNFINSLSALSNLYLALDQQDKSKQYAIESINFNIQDSSNTEVNAAFCEKLLTADFISNQGLLASLNQLSKNELAKYQDQGNLEALQNACRISKTALDLCLRFKNEFSSDDVKFHFLNKAHQWAGLASFYQYKLMAATKTTEDVDAFNKIFQFSEQNKSILLADALRAQKSRQFGDLPDSLVQEEHLLQNRYDLCKKQLIQEQDALQKEKTIEAFNTVRREIDVFQEQIAKKHPKYYQSKYGNTVITATELQEGLNEETLFLEYLISPNGSYLFAISAQYFQLIPINVDKDTIEAYVKKLRESLSNYSNILKNESQTRKEYIIAGNWLFETLIKPALGNSKIKNIVIVPDAQLGHVPFETFLMERPSLKTPYPKYPYLLYRYTISYSYSASLWKENLQSTDNGKIKNKLLAMSADYSIKPSSETTLTYLQKMRQSLNPLPAATEEVRILSKKFKGDFKYKAACNELFFKENAKNYAVIHLAMHGLLDRKYPILSSLVFNHTIDSIEDNFLQAYEISQLKLNAQLVVLSACETGYGKFQQGEGVMSLARSFMYAGVPSLVVSMWQVNDESTGMLMQNFYTNLAKGMHKDDALRQAKLDYIKTAAKNNPIAAHPAFWGAFIQLGNNSPIEITIKRDYNYLFLISSSILLLFIVFWAIRKFILSRH